MERVKLLVASIVIFSSTAQCAQREAYSQRNTRSAKANEANQNGNSFSYFHFIMGELSTLDGNNELALEHFLLAGQFDPESKTIQLKQAEQLVAINRVVDAKRILSSLGTMETPEFHLLAAKIAALELDVDSSVRSIDRAIALMEKSNDGSKIRETVLMKVALLSDSRRYKEAIKTLHHYLKKEPRDEIAYYFLGKIYTMIQERDEAVKAYQKSLDLRPQFVTAAKALGLLFELEGALEKAIQVYSQALKVANTDVQLREKLSNLYLASENFAGALEHLRFLASADPSDFALQLKTALVHFKLEQYEEAEVILKRIAAFPEAPKDKVRFYLAALYEEKGNFELAAQHYRRISPESEYYLDARLQLGSILNDRLNQSASATQSLQEAIKQKPSTRELYLALAAHFDSLDRLKDSVKTLEQAVSAIKNDERLLFALGSYLDRSGDYEGGIHRMREVLELNPNHAHAMNHIGYVFAERGTNLDEAEGLLIKAVQIEPHNAYIVDSLGWLYFQKGNYKKAREVLERAHQLKSDEPVIMEHLADVYLKLGQQDLALRMYQKIVDTPQPVGITADSDDGRKQRVRQKIAALEKDSF